MKYRIMQIGDKYAANIVGTSDYISRDGKETWLTPFYVMQHCICEDITSAKKAGDTYTSMFSSELLDGAKEITPCPVCNSLIETAQYYDCCSLQCYKDKH